MPRRLTNLALTLTLAAAIPLLISFTRAPTATAASTLNHGTTASNQAPAVTGLALSASPSIVDVGDNVLLVLMAHSWPGRAAVSVSFLSAHHGFTGQMLWNGSCSCFRVAVSLARRIHSLEQARAVATVIIGQRRYTAATTFLIRGLASDGRSLAPGGPETLTTWVSDPTPNPNEQVHICAWVKTLDGLGVRGVPIKFWLHYPGLSLTWNAGVTNAQGVQCNRRRLAASAGKKTVYIDAYARSMHAQTHLMPMG